MGLKLTNIDRGVNQFIEIDDVKTEIFKFSVDANKRLIFHHIDGNCYTYITTLKDTLDAYQPEGFTKVDRVDIINVNLVDEYDKKDDKVYYKNRSIVATVAEKYIDKLLLLLKSKDH